MIIIDEDAHRKLLETLKGYLRASSDVGSVNFKVPAEKSTAEGLQQRITALVQAEITATDAKLYFCPGGEVYILASPLSAKVAHRLAVIMAAALGLTTLQCGFSFLNFKEDAGKLVSHLEEKIAEEQKKQQQAQEIVQKKAHEALVKQRKQNILNIQASTDTSERIQAKRTTRENAEVMVIEDDAFSRRLVESVLGKKYRITGLGETDLALETYIHVAPNILFLDINLPNVTGHELLEKILQLDPKAYVVMLSGNSDRENITEAMKRGAKGFVAKPFTPDKLYQYIQHCPSMHS